MNTPIIVGSRDPLSPVRHTLPHIFLLSFDFLRVSVKKKIDNFHFLLNGAEIPSGRNEDKALVQPADAPCEFRENSIPDG